MTIAVRGTPQKKTGTAAATIQTDLGYTTVTGDTLIVGINDPSAAPTISDNFSNTFTRVGTQLTSGSTRINLWYCQNATGGANHRVTATANGTDAFDAALMFFAISGATSASFDVTAQALDSVSPYQVTSPTLNQAAEMAVVFLGADGSPGSFTETSGFTIQVQETNDASFWTAAIATKIVAATTAITSSWTTSSGTGTGIYIATFKESAAGGTTTTKVMSDTLTVADQALDRVIFRRLLSDTTVIIDNVVQSVIRGTGVFTKVMSDTLAIADGFVDWLRRVRGPIDTVTLSDGDTYRFSIITADDSFVTADDFVSWRRLKRVAQDNFDLIDGFTKILNGAGIVYAKVMSDTVTVIDDAGQRWKLRVSQITDAVGLSDQVLRSLRAVRSLGDVVEFSDGVVSVRRYSRLGDESIVVSDERVSTLYLYQLSNTSFSFGAAGPPFRFGGT